MAVNTAWRYDNSGALGFRRGDEVHVTDWGQGAVRKVRDQWSLPVDSMYDQPSAIIHYPSGGMAFIASDGLHVHFTDQSWTKIGDGWTTLPEEWKDKGVETAWRYDNSGALGFRRGDEVHVTDWGQGTVKKVRDQWSLPTDSMYDRPLAIIHYPSGGMAFIASDGLHVHLTDQSWTKIGDGWTTLPEEWKE